MTPQNHRITPANLPQQLAARTRKTATCWEWTGTINDAGYGVIEFGGKCYRAHRLMLELAGVALPPGMMADHLCRNRRCVNPAHLRVVDPRTNTLENSVSVSVLNAAKTHCKNGHPFTPENTYEPPKRPGNRDCLTCRRAAMQRLKDRRKAAAMARAA